MKNDKHEDVMDLMQEMLKNLSLELEKGDKSDEKSAYNEDIARTVFNKFDSVFKYIIRDFGFEENYPDKDELEYLLELSAIMFYQGISSGIKSIDTMTNNKTINCMSVENATTLIGTLVNDYKDMRAGLYEEKSEPEKSEREIAIEKIFMKYSNK